MDSDGVCLREVAAILLYVHCIRLESVPLPFEWGYGAVRELAARRTGPRRLPARDAGCLEPVRNSCLRGGWDLAADPRGLVYRGAV